MIRKQKCGCLETLLSSCLSPSMHRAACALAAKGCQLSSGACKRKSCLRAQIFVLKDSGPNPKPFLHAKSSWIAGLAQVSFRKVLSEPQLPEPPHVPWAIPLPMVLQKARSVLPSVRPSIRPSFHHLCSQVIPRSCLLILLVRESKAKRMVLPACFPWTLLPQLSTADHPVLTARITGKFILSC